MNAVAFLPQSRRGLVSGRSVEVIGYEIRSATEERYEEVWWIVIDDTGKADWVTAWTLTFVVEEVASV